MNILIYLKHADSLEYLLKIINMIDLDVTLHEASNEDEFLDLHLKKPFDFKELEVRMNKLLDKDLDYDRFSDTFLYLKDKKQFLYKGEVLAFRKKEVIFGDSYF